MVPTIDQVRKTFYMTKNASFRSLAFGVLRNRQIFDIISVKKEIMQK